MKFSRENPSALMVRSVSEDGIRIGNDTYTGTVAVTAEKVIDGWSDKRFDELVEGDFAALLDAGPEVIVVGTGTANVFPPRDLVFAMARRGVGLEVMDTKAAARTFNVLVGEGRPVAALLYPEQR